MSRFNPGERVAYNAESIVIFQQELASRPGESVIELGGTTMVVPTALLSRLAS